MLDLSAPENNDLGRDADRWPQASDELEALLAILIPYSVAWVAVRWISENSNATI